MAARLLALRTTRTLQLQQQAPARLASVFGLRSGVNLQSTVRLQQSVYQAFMSTLIPAPEAVTEAQCLQIAKKHGHAALVGELETYKEDGLVAREALKALLKLSMESRETQTSLVQAGVASATVKALEKLSYDATVQGLGMEVLLSLSAFHMGRVMETRVAPVVSSCLFKHSSKVTVQVTTARLLANLCRHPVMLPSILESGCVPGLLTSMKALDTDADLQEAGCVVLSMVSKEDIGAMVCLEAHAAKVLNRALIGPFTSEAAHKTVVYHALVALIRMASVDPTTAVRKFLAAGISKTLEYTCRVFYTDEGVQDRAAHLMWVMAADASCHKDLVQFGCPEQMLAALSNHKASPTIAVRALGALSRLAGDMLPDHRKELIETARHMEQSMQSNAELYGKLRPSVQEAIAQAIAAASKFE